MLDVGLPMWPFALLGGFVGIFVLTALVGSGADAALSKDFPWQFRLAAACRTPVLMFFVVPLSYLQRLYVTARRRVRRVLDGADR